MLQQELELAEYYCLARGSSSYLPAALGEGCNLSFLIWWRIFKTLFAEIARRTEFAICVQGLSLQSGLDAGLHLPLELFQKRESLRGHRWEPLHLSAAKTCGKEA